MKKDIFSRIPIFMGLFAAYPAVTLLAYNVREVESGVVYRPLLASLAFAFLLWAAIYFFQRHMVKSALSATTIVFIFFTYGHAYQLIRYYPYFDFIGGPHTPLALLALACIFFALRFIHRLEKFDNIVQALNLIGLFLLVYPLIQIGAFFTQNRPESKPETSPIAQAADAPDIYYIILDGYSRQDTLKSYGYDNSEFINELQQTGFYVATCSRANYRNTLLSLTSSLNLDYVYNAIPHNGASDANLAPIYHALQYSLARKTLEERGYKIVSFKTGYEWDEWRDADSFLSPPLEENPFTYPAILPFEYLYLQTTALDPFLQNGFLARERFIDHYNRVYYILDELPKVASMDGPKFVYAHVMAPHAPFVFLPDGSMNPDYNYYVTEAGIGRDDQYTLDGYLNNVQFISARIIPVVKQIIANSKQPPIIIIQGDHGYVSEERKYNILNAYYFPGDAKDNLYPEITPVNTFRLVFDKYLGVPYDLRADKSVSTDPGRPYRQRLAPPFPAECP